MCVPQKEVEKKRRVPTQTVPHHHDPVVGFIGVVRFIIFDFDIRHKRYFKKSVCACPCFCCWKPLKMGTNRTGLLMLLLGVLIFFSASVQGNLD